MTPEERKEYNKKYYEENKSKILTKACEKVVCQICGRPVIKNNLLVHYKLPICKRVQEQKVFINKYISQKNDF